MVSILTPLHSLSNIITEPLWIGEIELEESESKIRYDCINLRYTIELFVRLYKGLEHTEVDTITTLDSLIYVSVRCCLNLIDN